MKNYDSLYTGKQIDDAVGAVYGFSKELNNKLDKSEIEPYIIENNEFDTGLNELSVRQKDENEEPFSMLTVQAPKANPKEATLCLKVPFSGNNADETYFMDISCMNYGNPDESPEQSIYVNSRGNANLPNFNIGFTNNENQIRHKKLIINPDALPMMFKSDGILVKNTNDPSIHNWSDATLIDIRDINKKLNKFTDTKLKVYSHGMKEELDFNEYITPTDQAYANTLVMRDRNGKFRSVTPNTTIIDNTVATTEFVNSYANEKTVKLEPTNPSQNYDNSIYQIYGHMPLSAAEEIKGNLTYCFNISHVPQFSNIPQYNEEGRLKTNAPFEDNDVTNKKYVDNKIEKSMSEVLEVAEGKTRTIVINHTDTLQTLKSANSVYIVYPDGNTKDVTNDIKENGYDGYTFGNTVFGNQNDAYIICDFLIFRNNPFKNNSSITSDYYIFQWSIYKSYLNIGDIFLNMLTDVPDFWLQDSTSGKIGILETRKIELSNIDTDFSLTSTNPIQNKVITNAINGIGADIEQIQGQVNNNEQDIGAINSTIVKDYTNPNGDMTVNKGLTVSTNGDATVGRNLIVQGATELRGGIKPIKTFNFEMPIDGTETAPCSLLIYNEVEDPESPGSFSFSGRYVGYIPAEGVNVKLNITLGEYYIENNNLSSFSFLYNYGGLFYKWYHNVNNDENVHESFVYDDTNYLRISGELHVPKIYDLENLCMKSANKFIDMTPSQVGNHQIYYHCVKLTSATKTVYVNIYSRYNFVIDQIIKFSSAIKGDKNNNQLDWYYGAGDHVVHCYWDTAATSNWLHCKIDDEEVTKFEDKTNGIFENTEIVI